MIFINIAHSLQQSWKQVEKMTKYMTDVFFRCQQHKQGESLWA